MEAGGQGRATVGAVGRPGVAVGLQGVGAIRGYGKIVSETENTRVPGMCSRGPIKKITDRMILKGLLGSVFASEIIKNVILRV